MSVGSGIERNGNTSRTHGAHRCGRPPILVEHEGRQVTLAELAGITGIHSKALASRYQRGKRGADLIAPPLRRGLATLTPQQIARLEESIRLRRRNTAKAVAAELGLTRRAVNQLRMDLTRKMAKEGRL